MGLFKPGWQISSPAHWLTGETKKLMNQRDSFLRKARRSGAEVDWNAYRRRRNQVSNKIKNEKRHYHRNEIQENLNSPKAFWKAIKKVFPSKKATQRVQNLPRPRRDIQSLISQLLPRSLITSLQTPSQSFGNRSSAHSYS